MAAEAARTIRDTFTGWPPWARLAYLLALAAAAAMFAVGISRDRSDSPVNVSAASVKACLDSRAGVTTSTKPDDLDAIAEQAGDGGLYVALNGNAANVAVERTASDATRAMAAYKQFAQALSARADDIIVRHGNIVIAYEKTPDAPTTRTIESCL